MLLRRRMMGKSKPYDAEIEYLENTDSQYINTGFVPNRNDFRFVSMVEKSASGDNIFMYVYNEQVASFLNLNWYGASMYFRFRGASVIKTALNGTSHIVELSEHSKLDGENVAMGTLSVSLENNTNPMYLFALVRPTNPNGAFFFKGKMYYAKVFYGDNIALDLIPVRIGQVGYMYDKVSGQLFGNSGTGSFTLGPDI